MDCHELNQRLAQSAEDVCRMLLPGGYRKGNRWYAGSVAGEKGSSLIVELAGRKMGKWGDFAAGGDNQGGLLMLWKQCRGLDWPATMQEVKDYLGIKDPAVTPAGEGVAYKKPERPACKALETDEAVKRYLLSTRCLPAESLKAYAVRLDGQWVLYPYMSPATASRPAELAHWKKIHIALDEKGKKRMMTSKETRPCLFGWQAIPDNAHEVVITEGEIDAISMHAYGFPALSVPFGGGNGDKQKWIEFEFENLARFETIYLALDDDEPGYQARDMILDRLGKHRCRVVKLPYKDANECLQRGVDPSVIAGCIANARVEDHNDLAFPADYYEELVDEYAQTEKTNPARALLWFALGKRPLEFGPGDMTLWAGFSGHGKSQALSQCLVDLMSKGHRVCMASPELKPRKLLRRMVSQIAAMANRIDEEYLAEILLWLTDRLIIHKGQGVLDCDTLLESFLYARRRYGCDHFVLDSLMTLGVGIDDFDKQKRVMDKMLAFRRDQDIHFHLVAHCRKGNEEKPPNRQDIGGSSQLVNLPDNVVMFWRNFPKERERDEGNTDKLRNEPDNILLVDKSRDIGDEQRVKLWFCKKSGQYLTFSGDPPKRYVQFSKLETIDGKVAACGSD